MNIKTMTQIKKNTLVINKVLLMMIWSFFFLFFIEQRFTNTLLHKHLK